MLFNRIWKHFNDYISNERGTWGITAYMGLTAVVGGLKGYQQYKQGMAEKKYYDYLENEKKKETEHNYRLAQKQQELVQDFSKLEGKQQKQAYAQISASQVAALAASGINLSSVTAESITSDSFNKADLDTKAIRYNSDVKTWEIEEQAKYNRFVGRTEAAQLSAAANNAKRQGKINMTNTFLDTAVSMASIYASKGMGGQKGQTSVPTSTGSYAYKPTQVKIPSSGKFYPRYT